MLYAVAIVLLGLAFLMCRWYTQAVDADPAAFGKAPVKAPPVEEEEVLDFLPPYVGNVRPNGWHGAKAWTSVPGKTLPEELMIPQKVKRPCRHGRLTDRQIIAQYGDDWNVSDDPIADGLMPGHD